jgi:RNA polymerase sigma factor (sigma-70 family)
VKGMWSMREEIFDHVRSLRRYALVLTRDSDEAEDLVQEALTKALAGAGLFSPERDLRVWLFSILHNAHVSRLRRKRTASNAQPYLAREDSHPPSQMAHLELREVLDCLARLPDDQRRAVALVGLESMSYAQAAKVLGVPMGTLMSRLARGREALRRMTDPASEPSVAIPIRQGGRR